MPVSLSVCNERELRKELRVHFGEFVDNMGQGHGSHGLRIWLMCEEKCPRDIRSR